MPSQPNSSWTWIVRQSLTRVKPSADRLVKNVLMRQSPAIAPSTCVWTTEAMLSVPPYLAHSVSPVSLLDSPAAPPPFPVMGASSPSQPDSTENAIEIAARLCFTGTPRASEWTSADATVAAHPAPLAEYSARVRTQGRVRITRGSDE